MANNKESRESSRKSSKTNIVLIGMRGSGKTAIGKEIAIITGKKFIDTDAEIERETEKSIPEIFSKQGEAGFREIEGKVVQKISSGKDLIIGTGGGVVLNRENVIALKENGVIVLLEASLNTMVQRLKNTDRPSLTKHKNIEDEIMEIRKKRDKLYRESAEIIVNTDDNNSKTNAEKVIAKLESEGHI